MSRRSRLVAAAGVAAAALTTVASVAVPATASAAPPRPSMLVLTVADGESAGPIARLSTLRCDPAGGTHPSAADVCSSLSLVDGAPRMEGSPSDAMCPLIYQPVTVSMFGYAHGQFVDYERTFGNTCVLHNETGVLFQF